MFQIPVPIRKVTRRTCLEAKMSLEVIKKENKNKITLELNGSIDTGSIEVLNEALAGLDYEDLDLTLDPCYGYRMIKSNIKRNSAPLRVRFF